MSRSWTGRGRRATRWPRLTTARTNWSTAPATSARVVGEGTLELALDGGPVLAALGPRTRT
ncbi:hypothetical protein AQJ11_21380 [Streptomyces corchorusii]|uniref:Uncharacterized protein n=1 Tax=Streptomyces corchorusii TaxID=1903 RepID=A0A101Q8V9_STRCK|nr:hypothetical protein AQJ11_21380 [Streptomyces corchorusii]